MHKGKTVMLGSYVTAEEASVVYEEARRQYIDLNHAEVIRVTKD